MIVIEKATGITKSRGYSWEFIKSPLPHQYYKIYMKCCGDNQVEIKLSKMVVYSSEPCYTIARCHNGPKRLGIDENA